VGVAVAVAVAEAVGVVEEEEEEEEEEYVTRARLLHTLVILLNRHHRHVCMRARAEVHRVTHLECPTLYPAHQHRPHLFNPVRNANGEAKRLLCSSRVLLQIKGRQCL
jgi:hypothetical protein